MHQHSLGRTLARQFMLFTAALSLLFVAATLLLLFILEDSFINRRLHAVATTITAPSAPPASLPDSFHVLDWTNLPDDIRSRVSQMRPNRIVEFRRTDGRYVHVLAARSQSGQPYALVYDVTDELTVNPGLSRATGYAFGLLAVLLLCAYALARMFVARAMQRAETLIEQMRASPDPDSLDALAQREPVREFGDLLRLHSGMWREQLMAVERERRTLSFLGHELRTPLQSACNSLALLDQQPEHAGAWKRLQRAIQRLTRASNAILWLSSSTPDPTTYETSANACLSALVEEFRPLAEARGQVIDATIARGLCWAASQDVIETLLANLLLNAIQHGGSGTITLHADAEALVLSNTTASHSAPGFGMGLDIANRLAARMGWCLSFEQDEHGACVSLRWPDQRATH